MKLTILCASLLALCLTSCAAQHSSITSSAVAQIRPGITTEADLVQLFGPPDTRLSTFQGDTSMDWFRSLGANPATYIPLVGQFLGGLDLEVQQLSVQIGRNGRVKKYTTYNSNGMVKTEQTRLGGVRTGDTRK
jgi:outer membrane protein assembly factor BamE (lipoprotein component of BamABCDE complex)